MSDEAPRLEGGTAAQYASFAEHQARGISPTYDSWASGVARDLNALELIDHLPLAKRQPNLVFAAARYLGCRDDASYEVFAGWLHDHWPQVEAVARTRLTQTNEAGRCAVLLPVLATLPGPLALLEVGASAGLCLYPDLYSYVYTAADGSHRVDPPTAPSPVTLACAIEDPADIPAGVPAVTWRAGIDINPLDLTDPEDITWLTALVWPEHEERRQRLLAAAALASQEPAVVHRGDLNDKLQALAADAPSNATPVIFHSAVLTYLPPAQRQQFVDTVQDLEAVWVSNEGLGVLPLVRQQLPLGLDVGGRFVLSVQGRPIALTGAHGQSYASLPQALPRPADLPHPQHRRNRTQPSLTDIEGSLGEP